MNCCGNHSSHSHSGQNTQMNAHENDGTDIVEKKNSWVPWVIVAIVIILLIFSLMG